MSEDALNLKDQVEAAGILIRSGFAPTGALKTVGLDPIKHLGLVPVTVKEKDEDAGR